MSTSLGRSRGLIVGILLVVVTLGLGSRAFPNHLPWLLSEFAGDVLWAHSVYLGLIFLRPSLAPRFAAVLALTFSLLVEISQLYHAPWIDAIRANRWGGLVLGFGFLWSDLICYLVGVAIANSLDRALINRSTPPEVESRWPLL